jgi:FkbM family methyltransferase
MAAGKLVELAGGLHVFASSTIDAQFIHNEIFGAGCYDDVRLPPESVVIDVGAHIGLFLLFVKRRCPTARVIAFEPSPESAALLRKNIELHQLHDVDVRELALGSAPEPGVPFTYYPVAPGNSTRYPEEKELTKSVLTRTLPAKFVERAYRGQEIVVGVEPLSAFLVPERLGERRRVDLLKIDVEGAELEVLQGLGPDDWPVIEQVLIEVQDVHDRLSSVVDLLATHGLHPSVRPAPMTEPDLVTYVVQAARR